MEAAVRLARLAIAAEGVGAAEEALRLMVSYAKSRYQFGRPIGGFQAVKHKCAEALIAIEAAKATVSYASWALDDGSPEADLAVLAAKIASVEAFVATAADCIQIHGTFGYTREAPSQSYFRRARWLSLFLGSVRGRQPAPRRVAGRLSMPPASAPPPGGRSRRCSRCGGPANRTRCACGSGAGSPSIPRRPARNCWTPATWCRTGPPPGAGPRPVRTCR